MFKIVHWLTQKHSKKFTKSVLFKMCFQRISAHVTALYKSTFTYLLTLTKFIHLFFSFIYCASNTKTANIFKIAYKFIHKKSPVLSNSTNDVTAQRSSKLTHEHFVSAIPIGTGIALTKWSHISFAVDVCSELAYPGRRYIRVAIHFLTLKYITVIRVTVIEITKLRMKTFSGLRLSYKLCQRRQSW